VNNSENNNKIAVLGIGNLLMTDDGVGVHAVQMLAKDPIEGADIYDVGTSILRMQDLLEDYPKIVILDAVEAGGEAGALYMFRGETLTASKHNSLHDMGIPEILQMMPDSKRPEVLVLGVEPEKVELGMELSDPVRAALTGLLKTVRKVVRDDITKKQSTNAA